MKKAAQPDRDPLRGVIVAAITPRRQHETSIDVGAMFELLDFLGHWLEPYDGRIVLCLAWTARVSGEARAADDLVEVRWFDPHDLPPPEELAFTHYPAVLAAAVGYQHA